MRRRWRRRDLGRGGRHGDDLWRDARRGRTLGLASARELEDLGHEPARERGAAHRPDGGTAAAAHEQQRERDGDAAAPLRLAPVRARLHGDARLAHERVAHEACEQRVVGARDRGLGAQIVGQREREPAGRAAPEVRAAGSSTAAGPSVPRRGRRLSISSGCRSIVVTLRPVASPRSISNSAGSASIFCLSFSRARRTRPARGVDEARPSRWRPDRGCSRGRRAPAQATISACSSGSSSRSPRNAAVRRARSTGSPAGSSSGTSHGDLAPEALRAEAIARAAPAPRGQRRARTAICRAYCVSDASPRKLRSASFTASRLSCATSGTSGLSAPRMTAHDGQHGGRRRRQEMRPRLSRLPALSSSSPDRRADPRQGSALALGRRHSGMERLHTPPSIVAAHLFERSRPWAGRRKTATRHVSRPRNPRRSRAPRPSGADPLVSSGNSS